MQDIVPAGEDPALARLRHELEETDRRLVAAIAARMHFAERIGQHKGEHGLPTVDAAREEDVLAYVEDEARRLNLDPAFCRSIYLLVLDQSRAIQAKTRGVTPDRDPDGPGTHAG
jgi:chorismate mutase